MHELGLAQAIIRLAIETLSQQPEKHIRSLHIQVGRLAGVNIDALSFSLPIVARGTAAEGCAVVYDEIEGLGKCLDCGVEFVMADFFSNCPSCGSFNREIQTGREFTLKDMEVE
jgi:hydrogenase nickel incorporation protein HypA/HybF